MFNKIRKTFTEIKNEIKFCMEVTEAKKWSIDTPFFNVEPLNEKLNIFRVTSETNVMLKNNLLVAAVAPSLIDNRHFVFTDKYFESLCYDSQEVFLLHEEGHVVLGTLSVERNIEHEFSADEYAASIVGFPQCITALEEIKTKTNMYSTNRELDKRIVNLKNKMGH